MKPTRGLVHEDLSRESRAPAPSERNFGLSVGTVLVLLGSWLWIRGEGPHPVLWVGAALIVFGAISPRALTPAAWVWHRFGLLLHRMVSPLVLAGIFFAGFAPLSLILRLLGKRPLSLDRDPSAKTYWIERNRDIRSSLDRQF